MPRTTSSRSAASGNGRSGAAKPTRRRDQEVLEAATKIFYERGYAETSVQDIADELGILKGSLYHYIDTKEDLLFRLLDETHEDVHRILTEIEAEPELGPLEALETYVRRQVAYNLDHLHKVAIYYHDFDHLSEERQRKIVARRREHDRWVGNRIAAAQEAGLVEPSLDAKMATRCLFAVIIWTYRWYQPRRDKRDLVIDSCTAFAMRAVRGEK